MKSILSAVSALITLVSAQESTSWITSTIYSTTTILSGTTTITVDDYDYTSSTMPDLTLTAETSPITSTTSSLMLTSTTYTTLSTIISSPPTSTTSDSAGSELAFTTLSYFSTILSTTAWTTYFTVPVDPEPTPATPISGFVTRLRQSGSATISASVGFTSINASSASAGVPTTATSFTTTLPLSSISLPLSTATSVSTPTPSTFSLTALRADASTPNGGITTYNTRFYIGLPTSNIACTNCTLGVPALFTSNNSTHSLSLGNKAVFLGPIGGLRVLDGSVMPNGSIATGFEVEEGESGAFNVTSQSGSWFACPRLNLGASVFQIFAATAKANVKGCWEFAAVGRYV